MISAHLQATRDLEEAVDSLRLLIETIPDGLSKCRLQARVELLQETTQAYVQQSGSLYDVLVGFAPNNSLGGYCR